jgi:hypothetical protein
MKDGKLNCRKKWTLYIFPADASFICDEIPATATPLRAKINL